MNDLKKEIEDRVKEPLRGAYYLAVVALNWKVFLTILDINMSSKLKIEYAEGYFESWVIPYDKKIFMILILPLGFAVLFNIVNSKIGYYVQKYRLKKLKDLEQVDKNEAEHSVILKLSLKPYKSMLNASDRLIQASNRLIEQAESQNRMDVRDFKREAIDFQNVRNEFNSIRTEIQTKYKL